MNPAITLWQSIVNNPIFHNIPYKVETTQSGAILMSPASNWHGNAQSQICTSLRKRRRDGEVINECSILTNDGVKVADVAWASDAFIKKHGFKTPYIEAPEICVEIVSPGNAISEIDTKVLLYLSRGACEVWVVKSNAEIAIFTKSGQIPKSKMVTKIDFVKKV